MGMTAEDYLKAMQALLPPGLAWLREDEGALTKVLRAAAKEYERIDAYADNVTEEIDPRTTFEMLSDWENALGLPECGLELGPLAERREAAAAKLIETIASGSARSAAGASGPLASPQSISAFGRSFERASSPSSASSSRSSMRGRSSSTARWRARIISISAGALSQRASSLSPAGVRAVQSSSKSDPRPNRSRSSA